MKINVPLTEEDHARADRDHERIARAQREDLRAIAKLLEEGAPLSNSQAGFAAAALRRAANTISLARPRPAGHPAKLPGEICLFFVLKLQQPGMTENKAMEALTQQYGVSMTALKKRLGKIGKGIEAETNRQELESIQQFVTRCIKKT